jgi:quercetin dioxygenase-like cupin family protein
MLRLKFKYRNTRGSGHGDKSIRLDGFTPGAGRVFHRNGVAGSRGRAPGNVRAALVHFEPGARTAWHTHPNGQTIWVTEGVGLCQRRGGPVEVIHPGDRVFFEPGEEHWHGATPNRFMIHLAMLEVDDEGNAATWDDHVTDEEYAAAARPPSSSCA